MEIKQYKLKTLHFSDYNPRQLSDDQFEDIKKSLERFGFVDPVVVNINPERKNMVVGGEQRCKVFEHMGGTQVPVVEVNLSEAQEKELNIRLNKNTGAWDFNALNDWFDQNDLLDWGFKPYELESLEPQDPDEFFEQNSQGDEEDEKDKITLEFSPEMGEQVREKFKEYKGSKEQVVCELLGL